MDARLVVASLIAAATLFASRGATAEIIYPWCAQNFDGAGSTNCGFVSFEQCFAQIRNRGICSGNPRYQPPAVSPATNGSKVRRPAQ